MVTIKNKTSRRIFFERLSTKLSLLFLFILLFSCTKDEDSIVIEQSLNIEIEDKRFQLVNDDFLAEETCNDLLINFSLDKSDNHFMMGFVLSKNGDLKDISLTDWRNSNFYRSPDYNPLGLLSIKNFKYTRFN